MRVATQLALPAAFAALAAAAVPIQNATSTVSLFLPGADAQQLVASVVGSASTATTFVVACPPGVDPSNCGYPVPFTVVEGPSTVTFAYSNPTEHFSQNVDCKITASTSAVCTVAQEGGNSPGTQTYSPTVKYLPVTVTSGPMFTAPANSGNGTVGGSNGTAPTGATPTAGGAAASAKSTGGAPRATGLVGLGGVVAACAMAVVAL